MWRDFKDNIRHKLRTQKRENPVMYIWAKWLVILLIILLVILLLIFILIFIVIPIVFMFCTAMERLLVFINIDVPKNPQFDKPEQYKYKGITNFYITSRITSDVNDTGILSIGAWWIPHESYINSTEDMDEILTKDEYPVILYNHGVYATRILDRNYIYNTLRKFFHVVAIDYRDYGDSTAHDLSEEGVVLDVVQTYNLMRSKTRSDIFVWGHSLGGGISTHAVKWLKDNYNIIVPGLVIESSFTTLQEEIYEFFLGKFFRWLPWFELCITKPVHSNGFIFNTTNNIQDVDAPIMIWHAEDDNVIPFFLGKKNYEQTKRSRKPYQGNVTFHSFPAKLGYGHVGCLQDPNGPAYIREFLNNCREWKSGHR